MASGVGSDRRAVDKDLARLAAGVRRHFISTWYSFKQVFLMLQLKEKTLKHLVINATRAQINSRVFPVWFI